MGREIKMDLCSWSELFLASSHSLDDIRFQESDVVYSVKTIIYSNTWLPLSVLVRFSCFCAMWDNNITKLHGSWLRYIAHLKLLTKVTLTELLPKWPFPCGLKPPTLQLTAAECTDHSCFYFILLYCFDFWPESVCLNLFAYLVWFTVPNCIRNIYNKH